MLVGALPTPAGYTRRGALFAPVGVGGIRRRPQTSAGAPAFDPTTVAGLTFWLDATDLTQGGGIVTAINNKQGGVDPTITGGEEPTYQSSNASYNNRPTWTCVAGGGTKVVRASAAAHGLGAGPYTVVIVGQCKDANYAMGAPSGGTVLTGGGGSGNKWQISGDAGTYLASGAGLANNPSVVVAIFNGASSKIYVNSKTATSGPSGTTENLTGSNLFVGNYGAPGSALGQDGPTTHFLLYTGSMSQPNVDYLLDGFGTQSGITITP